MRARRPALASGEWQEWSARQSDSYWSNQYREPQSRLVAKYEGFAGSEQNSRSLVDGLRHDTRIRLSAKGDSTSFTSPTRQMGYGNVNIALALARASLADLGIRHPTPDQIEAALVGGTVLGDLMRARAHKMEERHDRHAKLEQGRKDFDRDDLRKHRDRDVHRADFLHRHAGRPMKVARVEKPERVHRPERPEHPERGAGRTRG